MLLNGVLISWAIPARKLDFSIIKFSFTTVSPNILSFMRKIIIMIDAKIVKSKIPKCISKESFKIAMPLRGLFTGAITLKTPAKSPIL